MQNPLEHYRHCSRWSRVSACGRVRVSAAVAECEFQPSPYRLGLAIGSPSEIYTLGLPMGVFNRPEDLDAHSMLTQKVQFS
jgi:hypothetical protein